MIGRTVSLLRPIAAVAVFITASLALSGLAMAQRTAEVESSGVTQGIKVHGHWVIEVRDPDGTLVTRREFDNAFVGHEMMVNVLRRSYAVDHWRVKTAGGTGACAFNDGSPAPCLLVEPEDDASDSWIFHTLVIGASGSGETAQFVLHGDFVAAQDATIGSVITSNGNNVNWTSATLYPLISVGAGQIVQVIVTMSFS